LIKSLSFEDEDTIFEIVNRAAAAYKGVIPEDRYHEPYMPMEELQDEMRGMTFFGWQEDDKVVGVIGFQPVLDVTLVRHVYVLPEYQRKGIGTILLNHVKELTRTRYLLVGTWAETSWAIDFYKKHGFILMPDKDELLARYWDIPQRQIDTSVVLRFEVE
jgi:GNAT superfamily N-acetyltransferase